MFSNFYYLSTIENDFRFLIFFSGLQACFLAFRIRVYFFTNYSVLQISTKQMKVKLKTETTVKIPKTNLSAYETLQIETPDWNLNAEKIPVISPFRII